jgi:hypothetical protein
MLCRLGSAILREELTGQSTIVLQGWPVGPLCLASILRLLALRWDGTADTKAVRARTAKPMQIGREGNIAMVEIFFFGRVAIVGGHGRGLVH